MILQRGEVVIDQPGSFLGKTSERLIVRRGEVVLTEVPFFKIRQITTLTPHVSVSGDLLRELAARGIQIDLLDRRGSPLCKIVSPGLTGTVLTRRAQYEAYQDARGFRIARAMVAGKIENQAVVLRASAKYRRTADPAAYRRLREGAERLAAIASKVRALSAPSVSEVRGTIMALEGHAATEYWNRLREDLVPSSFGFPGRKHRGAGDPFNVLLNYGYGILMKQVHGALLLAGLDEFAGFLHVDRPGKPSLVLDAMEEFRPAAVDRVAVGLAGRGFLVGFEEGRLDAKTRKAYADHVLQRFDAGVRYRGCRETLRNVMQAQARRLAVAVRGEAEFQAFHDSW